MRTGSGSTITGRRTRAPMRDASARYGSPPPAFQPSSPGPAAPWLSTAFFTLATTSGDRPDAISQNAGLGTRPASKIFFSPFDCDSGANTASAFFRFTAATAELMSGALVRDANHLASGNSPSSSAFSRNAVSLVPEAARLSFLPCRSCTLLAVDEYSAQRGDVSPPDVAVASTL